jgi:hypothetical protein
MPWLNDPGKAKPQVIVMVACNMVVPGGFELWATCAGPHADTSKTTVDAPLINRFRAVARSKSFSLA